MVPEKNDLANYEECMAYTNNADHAIDEVRGLLTAMKLDKKIKIAFDEWNLRSWHHPNVHTIKQAIDKKDYVDPRDKNDDNSQYTMADAVFTACFLNSLNRNSDIVGMANFAPILNTRGCIYSYPEGIVLRSTYHVFDLYVNYLGDTVVDLWNDELPVMNVTHKNGEKMEIKSLDVVATKWSNKEGLALAVVNKNPLNSEKIKLSLSNDNFKDVTLYSVNGKNKDSYNDINREEIKIIKEVLGNFSNNMEIEVKPHSVNIIQLL